MRILIVDRSLVGQTTIAKRIEAIDPLDHEALNISVHLADENNFLDRVRTSDVLIIGAGLEEEARNIARRAKTVSPELEIILFVTQEAYSSGVFRIAHGVRARKVLPESASNLDLLQELVSIQERHRASGRVKNGKLIVVVQAKGGVGATSTCAALGELFSEQRISSILWDLDIESRDLSRGLRVAARESDEVGAWIEGSRSLNRQSLERALVPVSESVSVLPPPLSLAAAIDMVGQADLVGLAQRVIDLSRTMSDVILVDTAGRLSPATGALIRAADAVVVMIDDSVLGLTAAHAFLSTARRIVKAADSLVCLCSGSSLSVAEIASHFQAELHDAPHAWRLPIIPADPSAAHWAGTGKTIYSLGKRGTRKALEQIGTELLKIVGRSQGTPAIMPLAQAVGAESFADESPGLPDFLQRVLAKNS